MRKRPRFRIATSVCDVLGLPTFFNPVKSVENFTVAFIRWIIVRPEGMNLFIRHMLSNRSDLVRSES